jgi:hypothetical protein
MRRNRGGHVGLRLVVLNVDAAAHGYVLDEPFPGLVTQMPPPLTISRRCASRQAE